MKCVSQRASYATRHTRSPASGRCNLQRTRFLDSEKSANLWFIYLNVVIWGLDLWNASGLHGARSQESGGAAVAQESDPATLSHRSRWQNKKLSCNHFNRAAALRVDRAAHNLCSLYAFVPRGSFQRNLFSPCANKTSLFTMHPREQKKEIFSGTNWNAFCKRWSKKTIRARRLNLLRAVPPDKPVINLTCAPR